jgi:AbiJ-like protein
VEKRAKFTFACRGSMEDWELNMNEGILDRRKITFAQAEGAESLPSQLKPKEISQEFRAQIWNIIHAFMKSCGVGRTSNDILKPWRSILYRRHIFLEHRMSDEFSQNYFDLVDELKAVFQNGDYIEIFNLLQFLLRDSECPPGLAKCVSKVLLDTNSAYAMIDGNTFLPIGTEQEAASLEKAISDLHESEFAGASTHLKKAATSLTNGDYGDSLRESIHAVESVARKIDPEAAKSLGPALDTLEKHGNIHPALKSAFKKLYGYTSDEEGIRHSIIEGDAPNVDETDAMFMIGACASFVSYLIGKARNSSLDLT